MKTLLEDYKRRLKTVTELIEKTISNGSIVHQRREERLNTKASCYRSFIAELEREVSRAKDENIQAIDHSFLQKLNTASYMQVSEYIPNICQLIGYRQKVAQELLKVDSLHSEKGKLLTDLYNYTNEQIKQLLSI